MTLIFVSGPSCSGKFPEDQIRASSWHHCQRREGPRILLTGYEPMQANIFRISHTKPKNSLGKILKHPHHKYYSFARRKIFQGTEDAISRTFVMKVGPKGEGAFFLYKKIEDAIQWVIIICIFTQNRKKSAEYPTINY